MGLLAKVLYFQGRRFLHGQGTQDQSQQVVARVGRGKLRVKLQLRLGKRWIDDACLDMLVNEIIGFLNGLGRGPGGCAEQGRQGE